MKTVYLQDGVMAVEERFSIKHFRMNHQLFIIVITIIMKAISI